MYDNIKFREKTEPFKKTYRHVDAKPDFKIKSVTVSPKEDPPPKEEHVICNICGEDLTFWTGKSKNDLSEKYHPV